jgi:hypothetical protein
MADFKRAGSKLLSFFLFFLAAVSIVVAIIVFVIFPQKWTAIIPAVLFIIFLFFAIAFSY